MHPSIPASDMAAKAIDVSTVLKSLSHPSRLMIACVLVEGERSVSELEQRLNIHQPHLSQHLTALRKASLVATRRESKQIFYRLAEDRAAQLIAALYQIYCKEPS